MQTAIWLKRTALAVAALVCFDAIAGELPETYRLARYLESNGTQYLDTKVTAKPSTRLVMKFAYTVTDAGGGGIGYGASGSAQSFRFWRSIDATTGHAIYNVNIDDQYNDVDTYDSGAAPDTDVHVIDISNTAKSIDGHAFENTKGNLTKNNSGSIYLFGQHWGWSPNYGSSMKCRLYSCQIYDGQTQVRDFVPCVRVSDNVAGLYDRTDSQFYTILTKPAGDPLVVGRLSGVAVSHTHANVFSAAGFVPGLGESATTGSVTCTAPSGEQMAGDGTVKYTVTGWKLTETCGDGTTETTTGDGTSCGIIVDADTYFELEWQLSPQYKVAAAAAPGGEVSATTQWIADCESAEITATPDADCSFFRWSGSSESQENPLVIPSVTAPMSLTALFGRSICVSTNGSDEAAGTASAPYRTPEMAIESAPDGSVITIGEGTYYLTKELFVTNAIRVVGAGRDKTFLDAQLKRRVMTIDSDLARVSGVTIRNGATTSHGGGVKIIGKGGVLEDCTVTVCNDTQYDPAGGGIYMSSANGYINRCIIKGNSIPKIHYSKGGGVWMNAGRMDNCLIVGNTSNSGTAGTGAAIFADGSAVIRNCTIVDNETTTAKCGGLYANNANVRVINCVLWGNRSPKDTTTGAPDWREASAANFDHCVAPTRPSGADCKDDDPSFKGAASGDYTFYSSSSLRNAGKDLADIGELDLNGNPRKSGQIDVGCYEFDESQKEVSFGVVPLRTLVGGAVAFSNASVGFSDAATYAFTLIDEHGTETAVPTADEAGFTSAAPGLYSVRLVVTEGGQPYELTLPGHLLVAPLTNYVDVAATAPRSPYGTPATAATNVLDVIPYAMDGSTVFVKDGLYKLWKEVRLDDAITMISENGAERTILKRVKSNNYRPLRINHAQALVRGFTMTGGEPNDAGGGGVLIDVHGGTLEDSIVTNNSDKVYDSNGGGVYIGNNGYVRRCLIGWNRLSSIHYNYGGGVRMGNGLLEDCLVISNRTLCNDSRPEAGGGVYATGGKVRNCTIIGNQSYNTAGGLYQGSGVEVYNCVIRDNYLKAGTSGAVIDYSFADLAKVWNCAMEIPAGSNCVTNEPAFRDAAALDFHLTSKSPLVNAGTNMNYTAESLDLDRNPRIFEFGRRSSRPDIGCYESPYGRRGFCLILR